MSNIKLQIINESAKEVFRNLFNLYHHDLSIIDGSLFSNIDQRGFYDYTAVEEYFNADIRDKVFVYLIYNNGNIAGFCVITKAPYVKKGCDYCIQEFFVIGSYRKKGIGSEVCKAIFAKHPGRYCLRIIENNIIAKFFWMKLIDAVGAEVVIENSENNDTVYDFIV